MLVIPPVSSLTSPVTNLKPIAKNDSTLSTSSRFERDECQLATAIVYCEANFGAIDGKTANGLIRRSEKYKILSVPCRSTQSGYAGGALTRLWFLPESCSTKAKE